MTVLFLILPLTLAFSAAFVAAYVWSTRHGQLDDLETPALRALHDGAPARANPAPPVAWRAGCVPSSGGSGADEGFSDGTHPAHPVT